MPDSSSAPLPPNEAARLALLAECRILDTPAESDFDDLTKLAAQICDAPIALISLVDDERQWFKSRVGLDVAETPRRLAFCAHTILDPGKILVVPDATRDPRFATNDLVTGEPHIRFYAGVPLVMDDGLVLGSLCIIDLHPRELPDNQRAALATLARQAVSQIRLRRQNFALEKIRAEREQFFTLPLDMFCIAGTDGFFKMLNPSFSQTLGYTDEELLARSFLDFMHPDDVPRTLVEMERLGQGLLTLDFENRYRCKDGHYIWLSWKAAPAPNGTLYASARDISQRKNAEEKLLALSEMQRGILESAAFAVISTTNEGIITQFNPAAERMLGYTAEEVVGRETPRIFHVMEQVRQRAKEASAELGVELKPGFESLTAKTRRHLPNEDEWTFVRKDGSHFPAQLSITGLRDEGKNITGFLGVFIDITARKRAEENERVSGERLRQAIGCSGIGIFEHDHVAGTLHWSPEQRSILGWAAEGDEEIGFPDLAAALHPEDRDAVGEAVRRAHDPAGDGLFDTEFRVIRRDDRDVRWVTTRSRTFFSGENGAAQPVRTIGALLDITARKKAEALLLESEQRFREAVEHSAIGMALVGLDGSWLKVNRALCAIVGRTEAELRRCTFQDITYPDDLDADLANLRALLAGEIDHYQMEKRYLHRDGHLVWVLLAVTLVRDAESQPKYFVSQIEDITERRSARESMRHSLEEKETLLKEVHHRVKNNLQVITSLLQLQANDLAEPRLNVLFREAQDRVRAMALVHESLYRAGNLAAVDFGAHVKELAATLLRSYATGAAAVRLEADTQPVQLDIDVAVPLSLIVNELVTNAFKHSFGNGRGGVLRVVFRECENSELLLSIGDDGPGLPADFQMEKTTSLGLKVVRILTTQIDGRLSLEQDRGTVFALTFPRTRKT